MSIKYNSIDIKKVYYNDIEVKKIIYDGKEVYTSTPTLSFDPSSLSSYTLEQVIEIADKNLRSTYASTILGKEVTNLQNSRYNYNARIIHVDSDNIYIMTTNSIGNGAWNNRSTYITDFKYGFNSSIRSKIKSCFIPTYDQLNGGWSYMNSSDRRALGFVYWTDTLYPRTTVYAWAVNDSSRFNKYYILDYHDCVAGFTV